MKRLPICALLVALAAAIPVLTGCGAEEKLGVDVAKAADATEQKGTARLTMLMRMSGAGMPEEIELRAEGVTALAEPRMNLSFDVGPLIAQFGGPSGEMKVGMRLDGKDLYVEVPKIAGTPITGGTGWIGIDLREAVEAFGIDAEAAGALFTMDPASQLRAMREAGSLEEVGTEEIDGTETTHLEGAYSVEDVLDTLPAAEARKIRDALAELDAIADDGTKLTDDMPVDMWVDADSVIRRMQSSSEMPAQDGMPAGKFDITYELSDFGAELDVSRPDDVTDLTDKLVTALEAQTGLLGRDGTSAG